MGRKLLILLHRSDRSVLWRSIIGVPTFIRTQYVGTPGDSSKFSNSARSSTIWTLLWAVSAELQQWWLQGSRVYLVLVLRTFHLNEEFIFISNFQGLLQYLLTNIINDVKIWTYQIIQFKVLVNRLLMISGRRHFEAGLSLGSLECW